MGRVSTEPWSSFWTQVPVRTQTQRWTLAAELVRETTTGDPPLSVVALLSLPARVFQHVSVSSKAETFLFFSDVSE